jgi:hypothetical protein
MSNGKKDLGFGVKMSEGKKSKNHCTNFDLQPAKYRQLWINMEDTRSYAVRQRRVSHQFEPTKQIVTIVTVEIQ